MLPLEKINDLLQLVKLVKSDKLKKVKGGVILSLLPWIAVMHLYHTASEHEKRATALEEKIEKQAEELEEHAIIYGGTGVQYAAKVEQALDDFEAIQGNTNDDLREQIRLLKKRR